MDLGMVGLGRMGANLVRRVSGAGHRCVVFDVDPDAIRALEKEGATAASSLGRLVAELPAPRRFPQGRTSAVTWPAPKPRRDPPGASDGPGDKGGA
jgi:6-phosphogluconate dehydrogenase (decarboxylating)